MRNFNNTLIGIQIPNRDAAVIENRLNLSHNVWRHWATYFNEALIEEANKWYAEDVDDKLKIKTDKRPNLPVELYEKLTLRLFDVFHAKIDADPQREMLKKYFDAGTNSAPEVNKLKRYFMSIGGYVVSEGRSGLPSVKKSESIVSLRWNPGEYTLIVVPSHDNTHRLVQIDTGLWNGQPTLLKIKTEKRLADHLDGSIMAMTIDRRTRHYDHTSKAKYQANFFLAEGKR